MDGDFEYHEVIEDPYYQRMPEKHVNHDSHQEIVTVVKRHQAAVFTCHVRYCLILNNLICCREQHDRYLLEKNSHVSCAYAEV